LPDEKGVAIVCCIPCVEDIVMKVLLNRLNTVLADDAGGEVLEYALIAGLIIVAAIAVITSVGTKVLARWTSLNGSL
jgi:Flp pilus assembly pilin Flp